MHETLSGIAVDEAEALDAYSRSIIQVVNQVGPAVVQISVRKEVGERVYGGIIPRVAEGAGSGVIFAPDGYILTNSHVVDGAQRISVTLADGQDLPGTLLGEDTDTDVAIVQASPPRRQGAPLRRPGRLRQAASGPAGRRHRQSRSACKTPSPPASSAPCTAPSGLRRPPDRGLIQTDAAHQPRQLRRPARRPRRRGHRHERRHLATNAGPLLRHPHQHRQVGNVHAAARRRRAPRHDRHRRRVRPVTAVRSPLPTHRAAHRRRRRPGGTGQPRRARRHPPPAT